MVAHVSVHVTRIWWGETMNHREGNSIRGSKREPMSKAEERMRRVKLIYDLLKSGILSKAEIGEMTRVVLGHKRKSRRRPYA